MSRFLAAVAVLALPLILASYISLTRRRCSQQLWPPFSFPLSPLVPLFRCVFLLSLHPSPLCRLPSSSTPFALFIFGYLSPVRRYVLCPELLFILISRAFCFSVVSGLRRKYKIIMIIMSHFARNNTVGAGIRRGSRAIRRANNVGRRGLTISRTHVVFFVRTLLSLHLYLSFSLSVSI